jgi:hypothetical protein
MSVSYLRAGLDRAATVEIPRANNDSPELRNNYLAFVQTTQQLYERSVYLGNPTVHARCLTRISVFAYCFTSELRTNVTCYYQTMPEPSTLELPFGHSLAKAVPYTPPPEVPMTIVTKEGWSCVVM